MEQELFRERRVGDNCVHERDCGHAFEVRQSNGVEAHFDEFSIERRVRDSMVRKHGHPCRVQAGRRKERPHSCRFIPVQWRSPVSLSLTLAFDVFGNLLDDPPDLSVTKFG